MSLVSHHAGLETYEQDEVTTIVPLLSPTASASYPETSAAEQEKGRDEEALHRVTHFRVTAFYIESVGDLTLRVSAVVLTLVTLALAVVNRGDYTRRQSDDFSDVKLFFAGYLIPVNVVIFIYSLCVLGFTIYEMINWKTRGPNNLMFLLPLFQLDQTFAYLLISASSNSFGVMRNLTCRQHLFKDSFCRIALANAIVSFLSFSALAAGSLVSAFRITAKIRDRNYSSQLGQRVLSKDSSEELNSPASKLLP